VHQQGQARSQSLCDASNASWQATVESRVDVGAPRHYARNLQRGSLVAALAVFELMKAVVPSLRRLQTMKCCLQMSAKLASTTHVLAAAGPYGPQHPVKAAHDAVDAVAAQCCFDEGKPIKLVCRSL
jgi:hypothetical protein